jgi:hypothetical protein
MIRQEIIELQEMGRMPNETLNDDPSVDNIIEQYDELLESIEKPISWDEGEILIKLFPDNAFYDLQWTLLHLIESLFKVIEIENYENLIEKCPCTEWKETMRIRLENGKKN